jgi:hypothetical protein
LRSSRYFHAHLPDLPDNFESDVCLFRYIYPVEITFHFFWSIGSKLDFLFCETIIVIYTVNVLIVALTTGINVNGTHTYME